MKKSTGCGRRSSKRSRGVSGVSGWSAGLTVTGRGRGVVAHAGAVSLRLLADRVGLTGALSQAMGGARNGRGLDRGRVLADVAVGMASGLDTVRRMDVLSGQGGLFAGMASRSTRSRVVGREVDDDRLAAVGRARASVRAHVWALVAERHGRLPPARVPGGDLGATVVLRIDTNGVQAFSGKEGAARQRGLFGLQPMGVDCDNTGESLVDWLRPGDAGTRDADDHIHALTEAIFTQLPAGYRHDLLVTADGAGCSHQLVGWLHRLNRNPDGQDPGMPVEYSIGWRLDKAVGPAVAGLPEQAWTPMLLKDGRPGKPARLDAESGPDTVGEVAEVTGLLPHLKTWPPGIRVIARRVKPLRGTTPTPLPGVGDQLELDGVLQTAGVTGWRYDLFATNSTHPDIAWLDGQHRAHARVEDGIRTGKQTGAAKYPFQSFAANTAWLAIHGIAADLLAWLRLLACDQPLAAAEPRTLQDRILHTPARLTRSGRRRQLAFPPNWPWTRHILAIFNRLQALPAPST